MAFLRVSGEPLKSGHYFIALKKPSANAEVFLFSMNIKGNSTYLIPT
jgi:hypothetical protein